MIGSNAIGFRVLIKVITLINNNNEIEEINIQ